VQQTFKHLKIILTHRDKDSLWGFYLFFYKQGDKDGKDDRDFKNDKRTRF
jgi:hypothetical protein